MLPVMLIIDSAKDEVERMNLNTLKQAYTLAKDLDVEFMYISPTLELCSI